MTLYDDYFWVILNQTKSIFLGFISLLIASKLLILPAKLITFINVSVIVYLMDSNRNLGKPDNLCVHPIEKNKRSRW